MVVETLLDNILIRIRFYHVDSDELTVSLCRIQSRFRGYLVRRLLPFVRLQVFQAIQAYEFGAHATTIQRYIRGILVRQKVLDCRKRREFIKTVRQANQRMRIMLDAQKGLNEVMQTERERIEELETIKKTVKMQHHLLSTRSCPGVFNPPFGKLEVIQLGSSFEDVIKKYSLSRA